MISEKGMKIFFNHNKIVLLAAILLLAGFNPRRWINKKEINNDVAEYYSYLPAALIYYDLTFEFKEDIPLESRKKMWTVHNKNKGFEVIKMTMGVSILNIPFFSAGHAIALISNYTADGYSPPYQAAIFFSNLFYVILGLFFLRKLLLRHFSANTTNLTLTIISLGTNLFYYGSMHPGMSHPYSFFIITLLIYYTELWHERISFKRSVIIGLLVGMVALLRASNLIVVLLFVFYGIYNKTTLLAKIRLFTKKSHYLFVILFFFVLTISPQFIYWKLITGEWYYYTYGEEGFFFNDPEIIKGLFSFRKGWLIYTPIMIFSVTGMFLLGELKKYLIAIPAITVITIYVIFSWWVWWYAGSFSCRPIIDYYGLLAIPLALFIEYMRSKKQWLKYLFRTALILLVALNIWQSFQYKRGVIHYDGMTKEAYFRLFFAWYPSQNYNKIIDRPIYEFALQNIERSESYYKDKLTPNEKSLFDFVKTIKPLKKKLFEKNMINKNDIYQKQLKKIIKERKRIKSKAYSVLINEAKAKIRRIIEADQNWYTIIKQEAKAKNKPVNDILNNHVEYIFDNDYPELDLPHN